MVKVVLVNPPVMNNKNWVREGRCQQIDIWGAPFPPFSLAMMARGFQKESIESLIIDAGPEGLSIDDVLRKISDFSPAALVIMTTSTPTIKSDLGWFASSLKNQLGVKIAVVGIHVTTLSKETLSTYPFIDFIIRGEPEITAVKLAQAINEESFSSVTGLTYKNSQDQILENPDRPLTDDLDQLGFPLWEKVKLENYIMPIKGKPFSMLHFARGCPHRCTYCTAHTYNGRGFRRRSVPSLIEEIQYNLSLGVQDFLFWTELMTGDHKYLNSFLDALIHSGLNEKIRWVCNSRVDTVNLEVLKKMKKAGCWQIAFGFDFGTDTWLKNTLKGGRATVELGKQAAKLAHQAGLVVDGHFMLGYPGETKQDINQTIKMALEMPLTFSHFYAVVPYPGSQLYQDWLTHQKSKNSNDSLNIDWNQFDQRNALVATDVLSHTEIMSAKESAYKKFYLRPQMIFRILMIPKNINEFLNLVKSSLHTLKNLALGSR